MKTFVAIFFMVSIFLPALAGIEEWSGPEKDFEYLWRALDREYALFSAGRMDWSLLGTVFRPKGTPQTPADELFDLISRMLGHRSVYPVQSDMEAEKAVISKILNDHIGWFENKDFDLLFSTMADDPNFFMFQLDSKSTIRGFEEFRRYSVGWKNPEVRYVRHEIQDLRINFSSLMNVAWFSCRLEDCASVRGKVKCYHSRWTGVLEKREGRWVIVQEHYSLDSDKVAEEAVKAAKEKK